MSFSTSYGSGQISGHKITDNLIIAGLKLEGHTFGVALNESEQFTGYVERMQPLELLAHLSFTRSNFDGIMGLAKQVRFPLF